METEEQPLPPPIMRFTTSLPCERADGLFHIPCVDPFPVPHDMFRLDEHLDASEVSTMKQSFFENSVESGGVFSFSETVRGRSAGIESI